MNLFPGPFLPAVSFVLTEILYHIPKGLSRYYFRFGKNCKNITPAADAVRGTFILFRFAPM